MKWGICVIGWLIYAQTVSAATLTTVSITLYDRQNNTVIAVIDGANAEVMDQDDSVHIHHAHLRLPQPDGQDWLVTANYAIVWRVEQQIDLYDDVHVQRDDLTITAQRMEIALDTNEAILGDGVHAVHKGKPYYTHQAQKMLLTYRSPLRLSAYTILSVYDNQ